MPGFVRTPKDEEKWSRAKEAAGKETKEGSKSYWRLSNYIFHRMGKSGNDVLMADLYKNELITTCEGHLVKKADELIKTGFGGMLQMSSKPNVYEQKGVHKPPLSAQTGGTSVMGTHIRQPSSAGVGSKEMARRHAQSNLRDLRSMPKPNLPKTEAPATQAPMKVGTSLSVKTPKPKMMADPFDKPSKFFKKEEFDGLKKASIENLRSFLEKNRSKK